MVFWFQVYDKVNQLYIYIHMSTIFLRCFSHVSRDRVLSRVPYANYNRSLLLLLLFSLSHDPMDCSLQGSSAHEISKTRILEWIVIFFSRNLPHRGIEPESLALAGEFFIAESQGSSGPY